MSSYPYLCNTPVPFNHVQELQQLCFHRQLQNPYNACTNISGDSSGVTHITGKSFSLFPTSGLQLKSPYLETQPTQAITSQIEPPNQILNENLSLLSTLPSSPNQNNLNLRESLVLNFPHEGIYSFSPFPTSGSQLSPPHLETQPT